MSSEARKENVIYPVSQFIQKAAALLNQSFPWVYVAGEISNLSFPASGHVYFSLKDNRGQIRCALFRRSFQRLNIQLKEGMEVQVRANVSIYEARGDFQLIVDQVKLSGEGKLKQAYEALKAKLEKEGLFDFAYKKTLPKIPKTIGVITSPTGAAIRDVLAILKRRFSAIPIIIYPVLVQGEMAAQEIAAAIDLANQRAECDVLLVCRGGGSIEDLWSFNEEIVARAIFASQLPIVSGVGHEVDFTISDFVADHRAPTPSGAAELVTPDVMTLEKELQSYYRALKHLIYRQIQNTELKLDLLRGKLQHPQSKLKDQFEKLEALQSRLFVSVKAEIERKKSRIQYVESQLKYNTPLSHIQSLNQKNAHLKEKLDRAVREILNRNDALLEVSKKKLDAVSPLNTLKRGYAIAFKADQKPLIQAKELKSGDQIKIKLAEGELDCLVEKSLG